MPVFDNILVNEHVLTKAEVSVFPDVVDPVEISKVGVLPITFNLNNGCTITKAPAYLHVVNDGDSADQIVSEFSAPSYDLKTNTAGQYADAKNVLQNFRNVLINNLW